MSNPQAYQAQLEQAYPELTIQSAQLNTLGQNSDILIVNDNLIFRFPRYAEGIRRLAGEVKVLQALANKLPLPIPQPEYIQLGTEAGQAWIGYQLIQGEPLWREDMPNLDDAGRQHYAHQIGDFLRTLHQIPSTDLPPLEIDDKLEFWQDFYAQIQNKLFQFMRSDATRELQEHFEAYFKNIKDYAYTPALRHGDFGTVNILHDKSIPTITGIIDFGDAALGDPAIDYAGLQSGYGEEFVKLVVNDDAYFGEIQHRMNFYLGTFALFEALHGYDNDDLEAFEAGMEKYT